MRPPPRRDHDEGGTPPCEDLSEYDKELEDAPGELTHDRKIDYEVSASLGKGRKTPHMPSAKAADQNQYVDISVFAPQDPLPLTHGRKNTEVHRWCKVASWGRTRQ